MLIALHGFTETDESWREVLAPAFPALVCPLLPGHGHLPCPEGTTISSVADSLLDRYAAAGPIDLLGYSMGGRIAITMALRRPAAVRRLVLISCRPGIADPEDRRRRREDDEALAQILDEDGIGPFVAWWESNPALRPVQPLSRSLTETIRSRRLNQDPHCLAAALRRLGQAEMDPVDSLLPTLSMPTLLIAGEGDHSYRQSMERIARAMPAARFLSVSGSGHAVHREQPDALLAALVGFFKDTP